MNIYTFILAFLCLSISTHARSQDLNGSSALPSNIKGSEFPRITPDRRVIFRVKAPDAQKVEFILGKLYAPQKGADGFWTVATDPFKLNSRARLCSG